MRELSTSDLDWNPDADGSFETASLVDRHSAFDGTFRSQRDIRVEGDLKGTVTCEGTLFVAEGASVGAPPGVNTTLRCPAIAVVESISDQRSTAPASGARSLSSSTCRNAGFAELEPTASPKYATSSSQRSRTRK